MFFSRDRPGGMAMQRTVGGYGLRIACVVLLGAATLGSGCRGDGPLGFVPGGRFEGTVEPDADFDWSRAAAIDSVDVEIGGTRPRTVRTGLVVVDGVPHLPVTWAPLKRWPTVVRVDPRVVVRVDGRLLERRAVPIDDVAERERLRLAGRAKYGAPFHARALASITFYFRLDPPPAE
jgi:hypothetical protein